jgi:hypothetical protein
LLESAVLFAVSVSNRYCDDSPEALAVLGAVCRPVAESPGVAPPEPLACLIFPNLILMLLSEVPDALAFLNLVIKPFVEESPSEEPSAFLIFVCRKFADESPLAESDEVLGDVCSLVDVESDEAEADAVLGATCISEDD